MANFIQTNQKVGKQVNTTKKLTNSDRNKIKKEILDQLTHDELGIFDKKEGYAKFNGTNLEMVMQCVVDGLTKFITNQQET